MEPVTHVLTGACLARSGLNRKAAYTTLAMAVAAQFPDIDTLWSLRGPVYGFTHHRGITHTFLGIPFEAALLTALVWAMHRWRVRRAAQTRSTQPLTAVPPRWGLLYGFIVIALLSHLALDFTNNYGLRPFFPFNPHWYAASIVFIFDPLLFCVLLLCLGLPSLFRLVNAEVGARAEHFRGRGFARAALVFMLAFYGFRTFEHAEAERIAGVQSMEEPQPVKIGGLSCPPNSPGCVDPPPPLPRILQAERVLANPDPLNPFRWHTVTDYGPLYHLDEVNTWRGQFLAGEGLERKIDTSEPVVQAAMRSPLGRAYIDWSPMPWIEVSLPDQDQPLQASVVIFQDPRFMGDLPLLNSAGRTPLTATVELDTDNHVVAQTMDGKVQR